MNNKIFHTIMTVMCTCLFAIASGCSSQDFTGEAPTKPRGNNLKGGADASDGADGIDGADTSDGEGDVDGDGGSGNDGMGGSDGEGGDISVGDDGLSGGGKDKGKKRVDIVKGCSDVGSKHSGSTLQSATDGVALFVLDATGQDVIEVTKTVAAARNLRDDIIDFGYMYVPADALKSGTAKIGLCDIKSKSSCLSALKGAERLTGDAGDLRRFTSGMIGYGFAGGPVHVLYTSDPGFSGNDDCEVRKSPLVLDLDGTGLVLSRPTRGVLFDIDADGRQNRISWPVKSNAGFVALDLNGNGRIDNGSELFGDSTIAHGEKAANGFAAMDQYDMNADGVIDAFDPVFARLLIWTDLNFNGVSESGELRSLSEHGVRSLDLGYRLVEKKDQWKNMILQESQAAKVDGSNLALYDLWFRLID